MPNSKRASSETGTKSLARVEARLGLHHRQQIHGRTGGHQDRWRHRALAPLTDLIPISPSPPVRFSTMTVRSSSLADLLRQQPAERVAAAARRERKDDLGQRPGFGDLPRPLPQSATDQDIRQRSHDGASISSSRHKIWRHYSRPCGRHRIRRAQAVAALRRPSSCCRSACTGAAFAPPSPTRAIVRASDFGQPAPHSNLHGPPVAEKIPPHRRQGRLLASDRFRRGRGARLVAVGAGRRHGRAAWRGTRRLGRVVGLDRARPQPPQAAARHAEAGGEPGGRRGRPDRAGTDLVGGARRSRHRRGPDPGDAAGHRGAAPLSQRALDHRQAAGVARGARHQRERHGRHQRDPLRRQ